MSKIDYNKREKALGLPMLCGSSSGPVVLPDPEKEAGYSVRTDHGLANERAKSKVRTHAELSQAKIGTPSIGEGVSSRQAMAGQGTNDQFPYSTDNYGKQIT